MQVISKIKIISSTVIVAVTITLLLSSCTNGILSSNVSSSSNNNKLLLFTQLGETGRATTPGATAADYNGNIFVAGSTTGNLTTCSGYSQNCSGSSQAYPFNDYFVTKYNSSGIWQWTKQLGETSYDTLATAVAVDELGSVYVAGSTKANLASCGGVSTSCSGLASGTTDYFITKYDSNGNWVWTQQLGETSKTTTANSFVVDNIGHVYIGGVTAGNLVACSGVSGACGGASAQGNFDYFATQYSQSGTWNWTKQLGETGQQIQGGFIAADTSGGLFIAGSTSGNLVACAGASGACGGFSAQGNLDYFISYYYVSGVWQWTKQLGETGKYVYSQGLTLDSSGSIYITGYTSAGLMACAGVSGSCGGQSSAGIYDYYISKYTHGGVWQWTNQLGETSLTTQATSISADSKGNILITGNTNANLISCSGISAICAGPSSGITDYFVSVYSNSGGWIKTNQLGENSQSSAGVSIFSDFNGYSYLLGNTNGNLSSCALSPGAICSGTSTGTQDYYLTRF